MALIQVAREIDVNSFKVRVVDQDAIFSFFFPGGGLGIRYVAGYREKTTLPTVLCQGHYWTGRTSVVAIVMSGLLLALSKLVCESACCQVSFHPRNHEGKTPRAQLLYIRVTAEIFYPGRT